MRLYSGPANAIGELIMHETHILDILMHLTFPRLNEASKLLSKGANVNFPHKAIGDEGNEVAGTPLMAAAANGNQEMVGRTRSIRSWMRAPPSPHTPLSPLS